MERADGPSDVEHHRAAVHVGDGLEGTDVRLAVDVAVVDGHGAATDSGSTS